MTVKAAQPPNPSSLKYLLVAAIIGMAMAAPASAQVNDPWSHMAGILGGIFAGPVAKGLALVAIVVGGLQVAFSEGSSSRIIGGLIFGVGLALGSASFISAIFGS